MTRARPALRPLAVLAALVTGLVFLVVPTAPAQAADLTRPFSRERVVPGDVDQDQWNIEHVYEVQIRLRRLGLLTARPNGQYGPLTERAVKRFQRRLDIRVTGTVNARTWSALIRRSLRGRGRVPANCFSPGWHVCYDRTFYQASLYLNGTMINSWLVRGGSYDAQTRTGDFQVRWRSEKHRSRTFDGAPMPYSQFFSGGQALHGSRNMMNPLVGHSHGCVNFWVEDARQLWNMTWDKHLNVHVYGGWA